MAWYCLKDIMHLQMIPFIREGLKDQKKCEANDKDGLRLYLVSQQGDMTDFFRAHPMS